MSDALQHKQESGGIKALKDALQTTSVLLKVSMVLLVLAFIFSGMKNLEQYEKAIVLRFGAEHGAVNEKPGLQFALPFPIDQVIVVPVGRMQSLKSNTFMYQDNKMNETSPFLKPGVDGYLLTADGNVLHCQSTLSYQVEDISKYLFSVEENKMDKALIGLLDNAVLRASSTLTLTQALNKKELIAESKLILQKSFNDLSLGVKVEILDMKLRVPRQVQADRLEVTKAFQDAARLESETATYVNQLADKTESAAVRIESQANIWKTRMLARAKADFKTFENLIDDYKKDPEQVKSMLLRDAMMDVSSNLDEVFMFDSNRKRELRLIMPRKPISAKASSGK
jgi:modulator of FtsH protease HflK